MFHNCKTTYKFVMKTWNCKMLHISWLHFFMFLSWVFLLNLILLLYFPQILCNKVIYNKLWKRGIKQWTKQMIKLVIWPTRINNALKEKMDSKTNLLYIIAIIGHCFEMFICYWWLTSTLILLTTMLIN